MSLAPMPDTPDQSGPRHHHGAGTFRLVEARSLDEISSHLDAWQGLLPHVIEPNVFYEPGFLMTLLRHLPHDLTFQILFVYRHGSGGDRELAAVVPLKRESRGPARLLRQHQIYWNIYLGLCTPLIHRDFGGEAIDALLDWLDRAPGRASILGLQLVTLDGPFGALLSERIERRRQPYLVRSLHERALLRPGPSATAYMNASLSAKRRKEFKRLRKRLSDAGDLKHEILRKDQDPTAWIEDFLRLEAGGWKGTAGTAFASDDAGAALFRDLLRQAHRGGQLLMQAFSLDDRRIAMKCSLRSLAPAGGAFAFKIAYDEAFARYSPGVLLELETIRLFHEEAGFPAWMDSCAAADHSMIDRLWSDRRQIGYILCAARGWRHRILFAALGSLPGMRRAARRFRDWRAKTC